MLNAKLEKTDNLIIKIIIIKTRKQEGIKTRIYSTKFYVLPTSNIKNK